MVLLRKDSSKRISKAYAWYTREYTNKYTNQKLQFKLCF
jgi:hypothetical protein